MPEPFRLTTADPGFDPHKPIMVNGYAYVPAPLPKDALRTFGVMCGACTAGITWEKCPASYCDECGGTGIEQDPNVVAALFRDRDRGVANA